MAQEQKGNSVGYKIHWHVFLTHFPISLFGAAFLFQIMHLFRHPDCFEMSSNVALVVGVIALVPTTWTGWRTWKRRYQGAQVPLFQRKIAIAFTLLGLSVPLAIWRFTYPDMFQHVSPGLGHWFYLTGNALLIAGAAAEGFYGGRLNHR